LFISGDADLANLGRFVTGSGTETDPYLLSGLEVDATSADYGIYVENVTLALVIRDCVISGAANPNALGGIVLVNSSRVLVERCHIYANRVGIHLLHCSGVRVVDNAILDNTWGISLDSLSQSNTIVGNYLSNLVDAVAFAPNAWSQSGVGNCWSDFPCSNTGAPCRYRISDGNVDDAARALAGCRTAPEPQPTVPVQHPTRSLGPSPTGAPPTVTVVLNGNETIVLEVFSEFRDPGAAAHDATQADLTNRITITSTVNTSIIGTYYVTYEVSDASGRVSSARRTVRVVDFSPPVITLMGESPMLIEVNEGFIDPGAVVSDNYDVSAQASLKAESTVDSSRVGDYEVAYSASDSSGNSARPVRRVVRVRDTTPPTIVLLGDNPYHIRLGAVYTEPGASASDNYDADVRSKLSVRGSVDTSKPGVYHLSYALRDSAGNSATSVERIVLVGWPDGLAAGPLTATVESVDERGHNVQMHVVSERLLSRYLYPLYIAELVSQLGAYVPEQNGGDFRVHVTDQIGELLTARWSEPPPANGVVSALAVLQVATYERVRGEAFADYSTPPADQSDAQQRAQALAVLSLGQSTSIQARAIPLGAGSDADYTVQVTWTLTSILDSGSLDLAEIRARAATTIVALWAGLSRRIASISLLAYVDLYGLVYRNDLQLDAPLARCSGTLTEASVQSCWVETYIHPLLQQGQVNSLSDIHSN
jgi:parallel beta-helix repeat protein